MLSQFWALGVLALIGSSFSSSESFGKAVRAT
jgi:hypothetical protein